MPNVKIFVDETQYGAVKSGLIAVLPDLRAMLCEAFDVEVPACQMAVIPVLGLPDQPPINVELHLLAKPERSRAAVQAAGVRVRDMIGAATGQHVAVRFAALDPATYVALK